MTRSNDSDTQRAVPCDAAWEFLSSARGGSHRATSGPNFGADHSGGVNISPLYVEPPATDPTPSRFSSSRFAAHAGDGGDKYPQQNSFPQQPKVRQAP